MEDKDIVQLFWDRNEQAIKESSDKYGAYCNTIAYNILKDSSDTEECVNDTWLRAWESIPPQKPSKLSAFFGRITRNLALDRYREMHRKKRGGSEKELVFDELEEVVSGSEDPETMYLRKEMIDEINVFLKSLNIEKRSIFVLRYWYAFSLPEISKRINMSEKNISVILSRLRKQLKQYLLGKGYEL